VTAGLAGLGAAIRGWRDRLPPSATGLPVRHGRRTAGLRREELAELAGLSVDYVVRLEQGRATTPSAQVVTALARALQLTPEERDHFFRLAQLSPPSDQQVPRHISPGVQRVLARLGDVAVGVFAADWQMLWWNPWWAALIGNPEVVPVARRNFARSIFPSAADGAPVPASLSQWPVVSQDEPAVRAAVVADLRRTTGRYPADRALTRLVGELRDTNQEFADLWSSGVVGLHRTDRKVVHHPSVGPIDVDCDTLGDGESDLKIVVMTTFPGSADETKVRLAAVAGATSPEVVEGARADR
jgi:transcriptional regulator with XRE-family HTH domain